MSTRGQKLLIGLVGVAGITVIATVLVTNATKAAPGIPPPVIPPDREPIVIKWQ